MLRVHVIQGSFADILLWAKRAVYVRKQIDISAKLHVSEYSLFYRALLQQRPMILDSAKLYVSVCILWAIQGGEDT